MKRRTKSVPDGEYTSHEVLMTDEEWLAAWQADLEHHLRSISEMNFRLVRLVEARMEISAQQMADVLDTLVILKKGNR